MIVSASRRTDIPVFYAEQLCNRLIKNHLYVKNPMNPKQVSELKLSKDTVNCFVFRIKNPDPMTDRLSILDTTGYPYYFRFTLTTYGQDMGPELPSERELVETFRTFSRHTEAERVIWRCDPVLLGGIYNVEYHCRWSEQLYKSLNGYMQACVISFTDMYARIKKSMEHMGVYDMGDEDIRLLASLFDPIAEQCEIELQTCSEAVDPSEYDTQKGKYIGDRLISRITGREANVKEDDIQKETRGCIRSVGIGTYHTRAHFCRCCYASLDPPRVQKNGRQHDPDSPFLIGRLNGEERIAQRVMKSVLGHSDGGQAELQWQVEGKRHPLLRQDRIKRDRIRQDRMDQERVSKNCRHPLANVGRAHFPVPFVMKIAPLPATLPCDLMLMLASPGFTFTGGNRDQDVEITAHRGNISQTPENTIPAFKTAIESGADWIELNIDQAKNGALVVLHDENLIRVAGVLHKVRGLAYNEIRSLDVGSRLGPDFRGTSISTLSKVSDYCRGKIKLNIEIKCRKGQSLELIPQMVEIVHQREMPQERMIVSFNYDCLQVVKISEPFLETGLISSQPIPQPEIYTSAGNFVLSIEPIEPDAVNRTHGLGKEVTAWTANDQYSVDKCKKARADNIITNRPDNTLPG